MNMKTVFQLPALTNKRFAVVLILASATLTPFVRAQAPVLTITQEDSSINFSVKASVSIAGKFDKWDATLTFTSPDATTGVLDIKAQVASVTREAASRTTS